MVAACCTKRKFITERFHEERGGLVYFARLGGRLTRRQEIMLDADAKIIAELMGYEFGGRHRTAHEYSGHPFFVPDDTLFWMRRGSSAFMVRAISTAVLSPIPS